jgi:hypothetical protein
VALSLCAPRACRAVQLRCAAPVSDCALTCCRVCAPSSQALRKSEQMLEEDALRFDQFLKDNDQKAVQAIKRAEAETKAKSEKVQEIKKLNMQITQIKSEMSKFEEQLEDCRKYVWPDGLPIAFRLPSDCFLIAC